MLSLRVAALLLLLFSTGRMLPGNLLIKTEDEGSHAEERKEGQSQGADYGFNREDCYFKPPQDECNQYCAGTLPFDGRQGACICACPDYTKCDCPKGSNGHGNYF